LLPSFYSELNQSNFLNVDTSPVENQDSPELLPAALSEATSPSGPVAVAPMALAQPAEALPTLMAQGHDNNVNKDVAVVELGSPACLSSTDASNTDVAPPYLLNLQQDIEHCLRQFGVNQWQFTERDDMTLTAETLMLPSLLHLQSATAKRILWQYLQQNVVSSSE
jgi:hypothetical protein